MASHDAVEVIAAKRDKRELSDSQIDWVINAYTHDKVADEQMSALAMAILLNGMSLREIERWTAAMIASGERMDFSSLSRPTADKHSTGGVGDKITLPLAPLVAACGVAVPQLSGRGLGHTGGTLDKLESIPGWEATLSNEAMLSQLEDVGAVICAAGAGLAPADKKLYALRDVTGTVEAIPLIASSIMSKKIAEGTGSLVLDVKVGTGAFMKDLDRARTLAETMVALGKDAGLHTVALLTDMSTPLGRTAGNALEVRESVEVLEGGGPADVVELTVALAREMLAGAGRDDLDPAEVLASGGAMDTWRRMIAAQGGDPDAELPVARETHVVPAPSSRNSHPAGRDGRRRGRLAAGRGPRSAGGQGPGGCGGRVARPPRRPGGRGRAAADPAHRRAGALRPGARGPRGWVRRGAQRVGVRTRADRARPDQLRLSRRGSSLSSRHRLGDTGRLVLVLDLHDVLQGQLLAGRDIGDLADGDRGPHPRADRHRAGEPHLVDAVVELGPGGVQGEHLAAQPGHQRQGQVAVRDRPAEGALLGLLDVDVDPLVVTGRVGELVHALLGDLHPVGGADLLPGSGLDVLERTEHAHGRRSSWVWNRSSAPVRVLDGNCAE